MEAIFVAKQEDVKKWVEEAVMECLKKLPVQEQFASPASEPLISREEAARRFNISTNTLATWAANGLPHYRNKRKVFYFYSEILEYLRKKHTKKTKF